MSCFAILYCVVLFTPSSMLADESDDTLRFYIGKSDLVVTSKFKNRPIGTTTETGVIRYHCEIEIKAVLHGEQNLTGKTIRCTVIRFEGNADDRHPLLEKDQLCTLFLKQNSKSSLPDWSTADFWFGIQPHNGSMERSIKRLSR